MSETRYTSAQISHLVDECADKGTEARIFHVLQQAAQDARVIEQLRDWLSLRADNTYAELALAELDRLAPPQRQE